MKPALCCEDLMSCIINSLMLYQPCADGSLMLHKESKTLCLSKKLKDHLLSPQFVYWPTSTFQLPGKTTFAKVCRITQKTWPLNYSWLSDHN